MKIGKDVIKFKKKGKRFGPPRVRKSRYYTKLLWEIEKIKKVEQLDIVEKMIENAHFEGKITFEERTDLYSKLNDKALEVGEKRAHLKVGPVEMGIEKKGKLL